MSDRRNRTDRLPSRSIARPLFHSNSTPLLNTDAPITAAGRVAYLGESSNIALLQDEQSSANSGHYPLPENVRISQASLEGRDGAEVYIILHQSGAFLLPPRSLCDELIKAYFEWVHPIIPIINRTRFMRQYRDPDDSPSLLLLQSILLAGSRACCSPELADANGSTTPAGLAFFKRAKALYDANYETDRVTIVQSLLLMGWYWEGPDDVTKNIYYWSHLATAVAQGSGMHRSVEHSQLSRSDKRLWKRIWWSLFTRDRSVALALGRPVSINLDDSDVEALTEADFLDEDESDGVSECPPNPVHIQFFLQYVKLCEIMGIVLSLKHSVTSKGQQRSAINTAHVALADWLRHCPMIVYWAIPRHHFWSALLHSHYYTMLCLLYRAHMPPSAPPPFLEHFPCPDVALRAAAMITTIIQNLAAHGQLRFCPPFIVYSLFLAISMHIHKIKSPVPSIQQDVTQDRLRTSMSAMKELSRVWWVGKMIYTLLESVIGEMVLEERSQPATGRPHQKMCQHLPQPEQNDRHSDAPPATVCFDSSPTETSICLEHNAKGSASPDNGEVHNQASLITAVDEDWFHFFGLDEVINFGG
ncbi:fungal-specific transcription factor domain-containing protein [Thelonectria olida]|uniref:Fungal-specific transcription factor domain-containing protein n=1 Tax=Thelonectria olida TaxID=1576542 RepID=A0A9P9AHN6_9HYPO|nr:fungal-specific transcription factor domain-containing protein [Thelonectria olida]